MSHPTPTGNGCSLEDCYTNLFALTDIGGIKWRRLTVDHDGPSVDYLEDPVLVSYSKCIQSDILCVWRRIHKQSDQRPNDHHSWSKELWIFWYGNELSALGNLLSPRLREEEHGSWDKDQGLSYECRTLLFKALHNLIERCLLSKNFVRLGKWFVQPYDQNSLSSERSSHLSFSFNFFLHGNGTVCASIDVRQQPPVVRLNPQHLVIAQENHGTHQVILAPYGLSGTLTGNSYRDSDMSTKHCSEDWNRFYPVHVPDNKDSDPHKMPSLVEVVVAGVRMKYPSCYVLLCDAEETPAQIQTLSVSTNMNVPRPQHMIVPGPLTPPTSPGDPTIIGESNVKVLPSVGYSSQLDCASIISAQSADALGYSIVEKVEQDTCITAGQAKRATETVSEEAATGIWDFAEPSSKSACSCIRHRMPKSKSATSTQIKSVLGMGKHQKSEKFERQQTRHGRNISPFHRRAPLTDDLLQFDMDNVVPRQPESGGTGFNSNTPLPQLNNTEIPSVGSPSSAAPSPLDESHSQPITNQNMDPVMPTLSPQFPSKSGEHKDGNVKTASAESQANVILNGHSDIYSKQGTSRLDISGSENSLSQGNESKYSTVHSWLFSQQRQFNGYGLKRPCLPTKELNDDELVTESLYSFNTIHNWAEYPVKKSRLDKSDSNIHSSPDSRTSSSGCQMTNNQKLIKTQTPQPPAPDPYEFSDEPSITPASISRSIRNSREELFPRPSPYKMEEDHKEPSRHSSESFNYRDDKGLAEFGSLTSPPATPGTTTIGTSSWKRDDDLRPKVEDLDHLFDSSEDTDNDEAFLDQGQMPPKTFDDSRKMCNPCTNIGDIAHDEIVRMYPTPPSQENNPAYSPGIGTDIAIESVAIDGPAIKTEVLTASLREDLSTDGSSVFKLETQATFPGSNKYCPVDILPSTQLSPQPPMPEYKPSWLHFPLQILEKPQQQQSHYANLPSIENIPSIPSRMPSSAIEASPANFQHSIGQQRTPMSYELQSPASNASSYLNKTLNSVENHGTNNQLPEVNSLIVNIILSDSLLNLFKDHNFDSCNICVCNMNIKGSDVGMFLPDVSSNAESQYKCTCGFSAVMNRKYGHNSGLFYEDEVDITGVRDDRFERRKPSLLSMEYLKDSGGKMLCEDVTQVILELLVGQFSIPYPSSCASHHLAKLTMTSATSNAGSIVNMLLLQDANEVAYAALDQGRQAMEHCSPAKLDDTIMKCTCLHKWPFLQGSNRTPLNSQSVIRMLKSLQPLLQDAIKNKRTLAAFWDYTFKVSGPLTWKDFHQQAGRGKNESSEPQPIPTFMVGNDRDWISVSPYALRFWDKQLLEPYGKPRDIAYVVVTPENDFVVDQVKSFFKELSTVYELCRLGRHIPISKVLRDGILRVGKKAAQKLADEEVDDWFKQIGNSPVASKLKLYAQVCRYHLGPHLAQQTLDKSLFEASHGLNRPGYKQAEPPRAPTPTPMAPVDSNSSSQTNNDENKESSQFGDTGGIHKDSSHDVEHIDSSECPALVVYLVDPFTYGHEWDELNRLAMIGLLHCYQQMLSTLPEHHQSNICLQIVPLKTITDNKESGTQFQLLKSMSFSIFTMCRWNLAHNILGRSLTGFGPAAAGDVFMKRLADRNKHVKLYSPPFVLAALRDKQSQLAELTGDRHERSNIIFCAYCLSEDQRWLLAACTDDCGEFMENCTINIEIPNRNRRKKASARRIGLQKLWDFIMGVISMTNMPARLVIGRFGRLGHGELKGWSGLLCRKNLQHTNKQIRNMCGQCSLLGSHEVPNILSACLISMEPQSSFRVWADALAVDERMSSNCPLQTPRDASCTHILVFPTSATAQANTQPLQQEPVDEGNEIRQFEDLDADMFIDMNLKDEMDQDEVNILDIFNEVYKGVQPGSPRGGNVSAPGSPLGIERQSSKIESNPTDNCSSMMDKEEVINLLQQPLAMGYYLSTAKTGPLPKWFWSACPENEKNSPSCFKAALHMNSSTKQDEFIQSTSKSNTHPLDSSLTCDVLRFVLENYNSLSWLTFDTAKNDRRSCLPVHFVVLMQMYHAMNAFV